jgi:hypothetical protein
MSASCARTRTRAEGRAVPTLALDERGFCYERTARWDGNGVIVANARGQCREECAIKARPLGRIARRPPIARGELVSLSRVTRDQSLTAERPDAGASFDEAGVDVGVIRAYLALSPMERLRSLQNAVRAIQKFRPINSRMPDDV